MVFVSDRDTKVYSVMRSRPCLISRSHRTRSVFDIEKVQQCLGI